MAVTFLVVNLAWVFFRAPDLGSALDYLGFLFGYPGGAPPQALLMRAVLYSPYHLTWMAVAAALTWGGTDTWRLARHVTPLRAGFALGVFAWSVVALTAHAVRPFLYYQF